MKQKIKPFLKFNITSWIVLFVEISILVSFMLLFNFVLNREWYDALSVVGVIYIGISLLFFIFKLGEFHHFKKIKNFFVIKKENNNELTSFEKKQMKILNVKYDEEKKNKEPNKSLVAIFLFFILVGLIFLIVSTPFFFS